MDNHTLLSSPIISPINALHFDVTWSIKTKRRGESINGKYRRLKRPVTFLPTNQSLHFALSSPEIRVTKLPTLLVTMIIPHRVVLKTDKRGQ